MSIKYQLVKANDGLTLMAANHELHLRLQSVALACINCLGSGGKILLAGNGGSDVDAQHMAAEFVSRFAFDRLGLAAISLVTDTSILTSIGNDYGYENIFCRQIQAIGKQGDIFIAYSTSGKSPNILLAIKQANEMGITTIGFCGNFIELMGPECTYSLSVPSGEVAKIQEGHLVLGYILCGLIEKTIFKSKE